MATSTGFVRHILYLYVLALAAGPSIAEVLPNIQYLPVVFFFWTDPAILRFAVACLVVLLVLCRVFLMLTSGQIAPPSFRGFPYFLAWLCVLGALVALAMFATRSYAAVLGLITFSTLGFIAAPAWLITEIAELVRTRKEARRPNPTAEADVRESSARGSP